MAVVLIKDRVTEEDLKAAQEEYGDFIKVNVDIKSGLITIGGEWHADGEKVLLANGSKQGDLWGGGINIKSKVINYTALINIKPKINPSHVIMDSKVRQKFDEILKNSFSL